MDQIIQKIMEEPDRKEIFAIPDADTKFVQLWKRFGSKIGISVVGEMDFNNQISVEYYFPYVEGSPIKEPMTLEIERFSDREAYMGMSDDVNVGMTLLFYMQNVGELLKNEYSKEYFVIGDCANLAGLASQGSVLLSLSPNVQALESAHSVRKEKWEEQRSIEELALEDMDLYRNVVKRAKKEDIFSIVETSFMPYGMETDQYSIVGTIKKVEETQNDITKEKIYLLLVECNHLSIQIAIAKKDLLGEPMEGRRLKANIWLQGKVELLKWKEE